MSYAPIVRVAVESPLPQLDRLFDYLVPEGLNEVNLVGCRVQVPFGRSGKLCNGLVVEYATESDSTAKLVELATLVSEVGVLTNSSYQLLRSIADRQAASLNEMIRLAVPQRSVRVEKEWLASRHVSTRLPKPSGINLANFPVEVSEQRHSRFFHLAAPAVVRHEILEKTIESSGWVVTAVRLALASLALEKSAIIVVPDFRDRQRLRDIFAELHLTDFVADFESENLASTRYREFLKCLQPEPLIVFGSRSALYAPVSDLHSIIVFDEADPSLTEQLAPYVASRDVALLRQNQENCQLHFVSNSVSCDLQRLIEIGYLQVVKPNFTRPRVSYTESDERVDSTAFTTVKKALEFNQAVLIQVAAKGTSVGIYCRKCSEPGRCKQCNGPLQSTGKQVLQCRWCSAMNLDYRCPECSGNEFRSGRAGSARTVAEFGKVFPGVRVIEATGDLQVSSLPAQKCIVVATPGAEPTIQGGYGAIVLLDAKSLLSRDTLRATEQALRNWANATSLGSEQSSIVLVGVDQQLGTNFALWKHFDLASSELESRRELGFPPAVRLCTVQGEQAKLAEFLAGLSEEVLGLSRAEKDQTPKIEILGPSAIVGTRDFRALIRFDYSIGKVLASVLRARIIKFASGGQTLTKTNGRLSRAIKVNMDDPQVI